MIRYFETETIFKELLLLVNFLIVLNLKINLYHQYICARKIEYT